VNLRERRWRRMRCASCGKKQRSALAWWRSGWNAKRRVSVGPEFWSRVEMPVDNQRRTGNGLRRLHDKMTLKNSRMAHLGNEVLRFVEGSQRTRCLTVRERVDPGCSPVRRNPNYHCGIKNREGDHRKSFDIGLRGCHRSSVIIAKTAALRQQKYPEGAFSV
jgi:hypothetical protein